MALQFCVTFKDIHSKLPSNQRRYHHTVPKVALLWIKKLIDVLQSEIA